MLTLALTAPLLFLAQDPGPDAKRVANTVAEIKAVLTKKETEPKVKVIRSAGRVVHQDVVHALARGLRDDDAEVQAATIEALRYMELPSALAELSRVHKKDKDLAKDEALYTALVRAIGQHADKGSIKLLVASPNKNGANSVIQASILGLGRIRDASAVEALMDLMNKLPAGKAKAQMHNFQLALMQLTAIDRGKSPDAWQKWWREHKKGFKVSPKSPRLPEDLQRQWDRYWGLYHVRERGEKREDRGNDGERG